MTHALLHVSVLLMMALAGYLYGRRQRVPAARLSTAPADDVREMIRLLSENQADRFRRLDARMDDVVAAIDGEMEMDLSELDARIDALAERVSAITAPELSELTDRMDSLTSSISELRSASRSHTRLVATKSSRLELVDDAPEQMLAN